MQTLPIHLDVFALVILLGVAQGLFLGGFFLSGSRGYSLANRCLGWFLLSLAAISAEIFLNYSNYMFRVLWLVDFAEPFNFVLGPLFYFFVFSRVRHRLPIRWGWHLLPFTIWIVNAATWLFQPLAWKYNSYIDSLHPELSVIPSRSYWQEDFTGLRPYINELTLLSCLVYAVLALLILRNASRRDARFWLSPNHNTLRLLSWFFALVPVLIVIIKPQFYEDLGDYLLATYIAVTIYATSFLVMRSSSFFSDEVDRPLVEQPQPVAQPFVEPKKKYEKSSLSEEIEDALLQKLTRLMDEEKPYLESDMSLPKLASRLHTTPHHLSQLLNDRLDQGFFDLLATYRIREAQAMLQDSTLVHLKIDEIAERVGYNSPSAFHTAFKRLTSQTPAQFRQAVTTSRSA
ncbi:MAG: AraC family transcriptional regulator [Spirosoma sp.]|nr:AraC family transcriptional regulator [Spirosoma sp.]